MSDRADKALDTATDWVLWLAVLTMAGQIGRGFLGW